MNKFDVAKNKEEMKNGKRCKHKKWAICGFVPSIIFHFRAKIIFLRTEITQFFGDTCRVQDKKDALLPMTFSFFSFV